MELGLAEAPGPQPQREYVNAGHAVLRLRSGGWVTVDRARRRAEFTLATPPTERALVHPHLAAVAVVHAYWSERESFHAGAFVAGDGVWGVLGERESGKSSLLASLALAGVPVLCDDLLVLDGGRALAGPRSIDLRAGAAARLGQGEALGVIGGRERWRLALGPVAAEVPFRGWIELHWREQVEVRATRGSARLKLLMPHRGLRMTPARPQQLIELAGLPTYELGRPRDWASHELAIEALLDVVASSGAGQPGRLSEGE